MKTALNTLLAAGIFFGGGWLLGRHQRATRPIVHFSPAEMSTRRLHDVRNQAAPAPDAREQPPGSTALELPWRPAPGDRDAFSETVRLAMPDELKRIVLGLGLPPEPTWAAEELFRVWAERDPHGARWYFDQLPALSRFALMTDFISGWATKDVSGAIEWLTTQPLNGPVESARDLVLGRMAAEDPEAALAVLQSTGWVEDSPQAMRAIFAVWIEKDPTTAMEKWRELNLELNPPSAPEAIAPVPPFTSDLVSSVMEKAQAGGPEEIVKAIEFFTAEELSQRPSQWANSILKHRPELILQALEGKLSTRDMGNLVHDAVTHHSADGEAIARALSTPELQALCRPQRAPAAPTAPDEPGVAGSKVSLDGTIHLIP